MADGFKGRRSRAARAAISAAHPSLWLVGWFVLIAVLLGSTYFAVRTPYSSEQISRWSAFAGSAYRLWRLDLETPVRYAVLVVVLVTTLYVFRRWRQAALVRRPGPIAVEPLVNATGTQLNEAELSAAFRDSLSRVDLNSPASIPGAGRSTEFLELLRGAAHEKSWLGTITGLLGLTWVTHAYTVTATARLRDDPFAPFGITVSVATLPRGGAAPHTSWAPTWGEAVERAAYAAGAAILPRTKLCRRPPWAAWRGLALPPEIFAAYLLAKDLMEKRRYDEALGTLYEILELDPLNLHLRLEIGSLQEQLQLFLDALETYDDLIALGSRADERNRSLWIDRVARARDVVTPFRKQADGRRKERATSTTGDGWRGRRAEKGVRPAASPIRSTDRHNALLIGRYRYTLVLGFSEAVVDQWVHGVHGGAPSRRDTERERLRVRLTLRFDHYGPPKDTCSKYLEGGAALVPVTPVLPRPPGSGDEDRPLMLLKRDLQAAATRAHHLAESGHPGTTPGEFAARVTTLLAIAGDSGPASVPAVQDAAKSLLRAACRCDDPDCATIRETAQTVLHKGVEAVLVAQRALQVASVAEVEQLQRDYRWFTGRRRPRNALTQRALRVARVAAAVRLQRVEQLLEEVRKGDPACATHGSSTPDLFSNPRELDHRVQRALGRNPFAVRDWQELYNAACVASIPLLPSHHQTWPADDRPGSPDPAQTGTGGDAELARHYARQAARALERAADSSDSHFMANQRTWLAYADPDLIGFRATREYANFQARNLPTASAPVPVPENVHELQLLGYVTGLLRRLAQQLATCDCAGAGGPPAHDDAHLLQRLDRDRRAWQHVRDACHEYRDWRARRELLEYVRLASASPGLALGYPTFPDPLIGDLADVSDRQDSTLLTLAGEHARRERVDQLVRLHDRAAYRLDITSPDAATLTSLGAQERGRVHTRQLRAWELFEECLSTTFFSDGEAMLTERTQDVRRREGELAAALALPAAPGPRSFTGSARQAGVPRLRRVRSRRL